ncbi:NADH dehydrogenase [Burkholderia sp. AU4i]|uniref:FAD-dependent oxidoreductase n=1 Tax=Burkholderia sp. AU4i TaxID=1335308 RepID=UPI000398963F|nr:FAD-dependent oxidoreductase [Burkholderia sp. AU4i]ERJ39868.1 NADH dehydrogenase [Burkholderia sp. AU4i]HEF4774445.1 FAD-dependent oxidoreductase [Burkholderia multivorans]
MRRLASWYSRWEAVAASLYPVVDLLIRLWLGEKFFVSGLLKAANWDNALYLTANVYPVSWMAPETAAVVGITIELLGPVLLFLGLGTRLAAIPLLILSLVIQFAYVALPENLYWAALFGWYLVIGAGPISLDRLLSRGVQDSALPAARMTGRVFALITQMLGPIFLVLLRCGVVVLVLRHVPLIAPFGLAFALGGFTRLAALPLLLAVLVGPMKDSGPLYLAALLLLAASWGPGPLALDRLILRIARAKDTKDNESADLPHVVIVGAGFGGVAAARGLRGAACRVTLIDRHNYHLFQPLLYQVATAGLSPADIATPIRSLFRDQPNVRVLFGEVGGINHEKRTVSMGSSAIPYDYLVLATGARYSYFGRDEWAEFAPVLKRIEDATAIRRRLLLAFELAENSADAEERAALLTIVIVGGGPTGVELAGAIAELTGQGMVQEFRTIDPASARILLVEAAPRILAQFPESLSATASRSLAALGVEVVPGTRVEHVEARGVTIAGQFIPARTVLWAAGVVASPAAAWLSAEADRAGRVKVGPDLSIPGHPDIFALGDTAASEGWAGKPVPGLAPAAKQGGAYVARLIRARINGATPPGAFRYRHLGSLATIGRKAAVADFGRIHLKGAVAWWLWGAVHIAFLAGVRNRTAVALDWFWAYLTSRRGTRLITDSSPD